MKYYMREFVWTPEAKRIFRDAKRRAHNMKNTEELFAYIEEFLHPGNYSHLIMVYDPFHVMVD